MTTAAAQHGNTRTSEGDGGSGANRGVGLALMLLGAAFLTVQVVGWAAVDRLVGQYGWPLIIVGGALPFYAGMLVGGRQAGRLAVPGTVVAAVGLVLIVENLTGQWQTMAYAWALFAPTGAGLGLMLHGAWSGDPKVVRAGRRTAATGLALFVALAVFFELVLNLSGAFSGQVTRYLLALALIAGGALILLARRGTAPAAPVA